MDAADWFIVIAPLAMMALGMLGWAMEGREMGDTYLPLPSGKRIEEARYAARRADRWRKLPFDALVRVRKEVVDDWLDLHGVEEDADLAATLDEMEVEW